MSDVWYLFDPDHPARAEQAMQRLSVADGTLVIERGTFADWGFAKSEPTFELEQQLAKARARARGRE